MDLVERLRAWTHSRQRLGDPARSPADALKSVVAVYATHPTAPLALWARSKSFSPAAYRRLDRDGKAVRVPAMRGTVFLVPRASAARIFTACRPPQSRITRALKRHDFSLDDYARFATKILRAAAKPVDKDALEPVVGLKGMQLSTIVNCLRYEGRLLSLAPEALNLGRLSFVATKQWLPDGLDAGDPAAALEWLAGEYWHAYGPARVEDFAWWAGVTKKQAKQAVEPHDTIDVGHGLLLHTKDEQAFASTKPLKNTIDLLPKWDAYTMGHAPDGRRRFVHPDNQAAVYTPIGPGLPGDGNPVVLIDREAKATWTFTVRNGPAVHPFDTLGPKVRRRIDEKLEAIAGLLINPASD
jgi:hypothetical protein